jgi:hypothetical protein
MIYVFESSPPEDWNHGHISVIAISKQRNEMMFYADDWRGGRIWIVLLKLNKGVLTTELGPLLFTTIRY